MKMEKVRTNTEATRRRADVHYNATLHAHKRRYRPRGLIDQRRVAKLDVHLIDGFEDVLVQIHE